ncbi:MAG: hypothetical protein MJE77_06295 [Proteobacteria bacterium]|nr:hypothetical protein [Pseudomonadota bacterium]
MATTQQLDGRLSGSELAERLPELKGDGLHLSTRIAAPCWRFPGETATKGSIILWVECWERSYATQDGRDYDVEGDAALMFESVGPFCALLSPGDHPNFDKVNRRVEDNLERLLDLLMSVANKLRPRSIKVFNDQGVYQPLNSHLVFFREAAVLLHDLHFLKRLWDEGLRGYNTPPLRESLSNLDRMALNLWRDEDAQLELLLQLKDRIDRTSQLDIGNIARLDWERFDNYEGDTGRIVLEYPDFMNSFLDQFYLALLDLV